MSKAVNQNQSRSRYYDGQLLSSKDLRDDHTHSDWLRRLHLRVLHDTWGIALGLNVLQTGTAHLFVTPGLSYDGWGREVILTETLKIPIPSNISAEGVVLSIRYDETLGDDPQISAAHVPSDGLNPAQERPTFFWQAPNQMRLGEDIPLVLIRLNHNQPELDLSIRRYAQTLQRPHIGWDTFSVKITNEQELAFYLWKLPGEDNPVVGLQFQIDTTEAGFTQTPFYFANVEITTNNPRFDLLRNMTFKSIANPAPDRFTFQILFLPEQSNFSNILGATLMMANRQELSVLQISISWMGIELVTGSEPNSAEQRVFSWGGVRLLDW